MSFVDFAWFCGGTPPKFSVAGPMLESLVIWKQLLTWENIAWNWLHELQIITCKLILSSQNVIQDWPNGIQKGWCETARSNKPLIISSAKKYVLYLGHLWEHWPVLRWSSSNGHAIIISGKLKTIPTTPWISNWQTPRTHVTFIPNVKNTFRSTTHLFCLNVGPPKCTGLTHQVLYLNCHKLMVSPMLRHTDFPKHVFFFSAD